MFLYLVFSVEIQPPLKDSVEIHAVKNLKGMMRAEEKVLKQIYKLVKGDTSPVHLPVSAEIVGEVTNLPLERVLACCKVLENHGFLVSSNGLTGPRFYITKAGMAEAQKPNVSLFVHAPANGSRRRV